MKRILIFDDDTEIFSILDYIMDENGWKLYTEITCKDIVNKVKTIRPDVILMDHRIAETGGIVATQTLKKEAELKNIPVIYFSAINDIASLAAEAGADLFIAKPFDIDHLENVIKEALSAS